MYMAQSLYSQCGFGQRHRIGVLGEERKQKDPLGVLEICVKVRRSESERNDGEKSGNHLYSLLWKASSSFLSDGFIFFTLLERLIMCIASSSPLLSMPTAVVLINQFERNICRKAQQTKPAPTHIWTNTLYTNDIFCTLPQICATSFPQFLMHCSPPSLFFFISSSLFY
jgi:hypothetical protein